MTALTFSIGSHRYGIDVSDVTTVLPVPSLRRLEFAPPWVAGVFRYRGRLMPVVDLSHVHTGRASRATFGTRIVVVEYPCGANRPRPLGLMAEDMTDIVELDGASMQSTGVETREAPWLGSVGVDAGGTLIQVVRPDRILPDAVRDVLFRDEDDE